MKLDEIIQKSPKSPTLSNTKILGLDPGGTTGYAYVNYTPGSTQLIDAGQFPSTFSSLDHLFGEYIPDIVVIESYKLYPWKAKEQAWSGLQTPRYIGAIEYVLWKLEHWIAFQSAGQGKSFASNDKLREWGLYQTGEVHANDAVRHVCQYLIFGKNVKLERIDGNAQYNGR